jgi:hypothetical protein
MAVSDARQLAGGVNVVINDPRDIVAAGDVGSGLCPEGEGVGGGGGGGGGLSKPDRVSSLSLSAASSSAAGH